MPQHNVSLKLTNQFTNKFLIEKARGGLTCKYEHFDYMREFVKAIEQRSAPYCKLAKEMQALVKANQKLCYQKHGEFFLGHLADSIDACAQKEHEEVRKVSKIDWQQYPTADEINAYIEAGEAYYNKLIECMDEILDHSY